MSSKLNDRIANHFFGTESNSCFGINESTPLLIFANIFIAVKGNDFGGILVLAGPFRFFYALRTPF